MKKITSIECADGSSAYVAIFRDESQPDKRILAMKHNGVYRFYPQYWQDGNPRWTGYLAPDGKSMVWADDLNTAMAVTECDGYER